MIGGFDIGSLFGWAVLSETGDLIDSGTWKLSGSNHEGGGYRFIRLESNLRALLVAYPEIRVCGYELVRRRPEKSGIEAGHVYGEYRGILKKVLEELRIPFAPIEVGHMKQTATGSGRASKAKMVMAAEKRWGGKFGEDEADALWCAERMRINISTKSQSAFHAWKASQLKEETSF